MHACCIHLPVFTKTVPSTETLTLVEVEFGIDREEFPGLVAESNEGVQEMSTFLSRDVIDVVVHGERPIQGP